MQIKTIELTGEEIKVELERPYIFVEINNANNNEEILASVNPDIVRGNDNVLIIKANSAGTLGDVGFPKIKEIYLSGSGKIEIIAKDFVTSSVNIYAKGGGISPTPPSPDVLKFLPHPEGINYYWDHTYGVDDTSWKDCLADKVIAAEADRSFVVENNSVYLTPRGTLNEKAAALNNYANSPNMVKYYLYTPMIAWTSSISAVPLKELISETQYAYETQYNYKNKPAYAFFYVPSSTSLNQRTQTNYENVIGKANLNQIVDSVFAFAIVNNSKTFDIYTTIRPITGLEENPDLGKPIHATIDANIDIVHNSIEFNSGFGFKAFLIGEETTNVDHINENLLALVNHYGVN